MYLNLAEVLNETTQDFKASLQRSIAKLAKSYNAAIDIPSAQEGLGNLIEELSTKGKVVMLIDEIHFARIPYAKEGCYQALFLTFLELSGIKAQGEVVTSKGRIDVLCELAGMFYIFELKVDQEAAIGMEQTLHQEYSQRCRQQGKKIVVMGVSFFSTTRGIAEWQGELLDEHEKLLRKLAPEAKQ